MKIVFYLVHPAHLHLFKNVIKILRKDTYEIKIIIRPKESLEKLCLEEGFEYTKVSDGSRKNNKFSMFIDIVQRDYHAFNLIRKFKPDLMIGSSVEISHVGKLLNIPSIITHEDDADNMKFFSYSAFPFASVILSPDGCRQGRWEKKTVHYPGYHELAYLHPNNYKPDDNIKQILGCDDYYLLRFSQFNAHHDFGFSGISDTLANEIIMLLEPFGQVFISSERPLPESLEKYRVSLPPSKIHDLLNSAKMYIGDSQSMTVEAAILGVPAIRFNKFADNLSISVLDELENKYNLAIGINSNNPDYLITTINSLLQNREINRIWLERREIMLREKIDTCSFITDFIKNYLKRIKK